MPITHFNFQFEKEGARRIALAEQPRPTKECTRYDVAHTRFSLFYVITIRPVDGSNCGRQENRWRVCNLSTFPGSLDSLQSRPKKRAQERAIRASYGLWSSFNSGLVLLVALFNYELLITNYLFTSLQGKGFSGT